MQKCPVKLRASRVRMHCAASAMIDGSASADALACFGAQGDPDGAAVSMIVRGQSALTAMPARSNSSAIPSTHRLIRTSRSYRRRAARTSAGSQVERRRNRQHVRVVERRRYGRHFCEQRNVPRRVDLLHQVEALHRRVERAGQADGAGVVHEHVDAAERFHRRARPRARPQLRRACRPRAAARLRRPLRSPRPPCRSCREAWDAARPSWPPRRCWRRRARREGRWPCRCPGSRR